MRARLLVALPLVGLSCANPPPPEPPPPVVIAAPPPVTATATVTAARPPKPPAGRRFARTTKNLAETIDDDLGAMPCDLDRSYRGKIGKTPLTLLLHPGQGASLGGLVHYDKPGPAIVVTGRRHQGTDFRLAEKGGGAFVGHCDEKGKLVGEYTLGRRKEAFELLPRPAEWPGIHLVRHHKAAEPHHKLCAKNAKPDRVVELGGDAEPVIICLPTDPKKKKQLLADAPNLLCTADESSYRVFGLGDAADKRANRALEGAFMEKADKEIKTCSGTFSTSRSVSLVTARKDLLVVSYFYSTDYGGAHPMNAGGGAEVVDLVKGQRVLLRDIVDPVGLVDVAVACLPFYATTLTRKDEIVLEEPPPPLGCGHEPTMGRLIWQCEKGDPAEPAWSVVPEGIVIGSWANPHVAAADDGKGPVISWSVLLRDNLLRPASPLARLWAGMKPANKDAPACPSVYRGDHIDTWTELPKAR